ncbi:hypothetical protein [Flavobacterium caeni]|uniref:Uncharacterized protein n=1 Tax=Flavobacterium caeni TaxID=490189 RepID=A0A1G5GJG4_9FLAO|nr:hypothetical protein [Flavobacterium caeni]SCY51726.1 hypothetical protein SAMN02927903_01605 [Flavobacterium caeni]
MKKQDLSYGMLTGIALFFGQRLFVVVFPQTTSVEGFDFADLTEY